MSKGQLLNWQKQELPGNYCVLTASINFAWRSTKHRRKDPSKSWQTNWLKCLTPTSSCRNHPLSPGTRAECCGQSGPFSATVKRTLIVGQCWSESVIFPVI